MKKPKEANAVKMTSAAAVIAALRRRYAPPEWALFENLSNATGGGARRWADAVAMSLWPSRGLIVNGFEIKISRTDVLRELSDPSKAEEVAKYCDFWWLAVGDVSIAKADEIPSTWGLLVPTAAKATTMKIVKQAVQMKPRPLDRPFIAAILRRTAEHFDVDRIRRETRSAIYQEVSAQAEDSYQKSHEYEIEQLRKRAESAERDAAQAREQLNVALGEGFRPDALREAMKLLSLLGGWMGAEPALRRTLATLDHHGKAIDATRAGLTATLELLETLLDKRSSPEMET